MPWKKGESGNPGGRPAGKEGRARRADTLVIDLLPQIADAVGKRPPVYILYGGFEDRALGGWFDQKGIFSTMEDARAAGHAFLDRSPVLGWFHIVDLDQEDVVERYENSFVDDYVVVGDDE